MPFPRRRRAARRGSNSQSFPARRGAGAPPPTPRRGASGAPGGTGAGGLPRLPGASREGAARRPSSGRRQAARRLRSTSWRIMGVKMSCIASSIFPPGTTIEFGRDMNESRSIESR